MHLGDVASQTWRQQIRRVSQAEAHHVNRRTYKRQRDTIGVWR